MKRRGILLIAVSTALLCVPPSTLLAGEGKHRFGVEGGLAYTPDDSFDGVGWAVAGFTEWPFTNYWAIRTTLGGVFLEADVDDRNPNANYAFATFSFAGQDLFSFVGGLGLYYVVLQEPLVDHAQSRLEPGVHGGVLLSVPYRHRHFITSSFMAHAVYGDGPDFLVTLTGGFVF